MKKSKKKFAIIGVLVALVIGVIIFAYSSGSRDMSLVGTWRDQRSSTTIEFSRNGTGVIITRWGEEFDISWSTSGGRLIISDRWNENIVDYAIIDNSTLQIFDEIELGELINIAGLWAQPDATVHPNTYTRLARN
ncbi:MAG: hypothetical protein FWD82_07520 [Defluviitaleaceae bacterium]|nr:hypothetical protein [Defluviitaleaceae bacterium]